MVFQKTLNNHRRYHPQKAHQSRWIHWYSCSSQTLTLLGHHSNFLSLIQVFLIHFACIIGLLQRSCFRGSEKAQFSSPLIVHFERRTLTQGCHLV